MGPFSPVQGFSQWAHDSPAVIPRCPTASWTARSVNEQLVARRWLSRLEYTRAVSKPSPAFPLGFDPARGYSGHSTGAGPHAKLLRSQPRLCLGASEESGRHEHADPRQ